MSGTCKVLIAGPCQGKLARLLKRVSTVNQKNGPFDVLFCLGPFFDNTGICTHQLAVKALAPTTICTFPGTVDDAGAEAQLTALLADPDAIPLPTYFIGAWGAAADAVLRTLITSTHPKLHYLGRCVHLTITSHTQGALRCSQGWRAASTGAHSGIPRRELQ